jgi:hypothetical protein
MVSPYAPSLDEKIELARYEHHTPHTRRRSYIVFRLLERAPWKYRPTVFSHKVWGSTAPFRRDGYPPSGMFIAHTGLAGHRGYRSTLDQIRSHFSWSTMETYLTSFCENCLHCLSALGGDEKPRPLGEALHASEPNEIIHFDVLYMGVEEWFS